VLVLVLTGSGFGWRTENGDCHVQRTENNTERFIVFSY